MIHVLTQQRTSSATENRMLGNILCLFLGTVKAAELPDDNIFTIASFIPNYRALVAFGMTHKEAYRHLQPIFKFQQVCSANLSSSWPLLTINMRDLIVNGCEESCLEHMNKYSAIFRDIRIVGVPFQRDILVSFMSALRNTESIIHISEFHPLNKNLLIESPKALEGKHINLEITFGDTSFSTLFSEIYSILRTPNVDIVKLSLKGNAVYTSPYPHSLYQLIEAVSQSQMKSLTMHFWGINDSNEKIISSSTKLPKTKLETIDFRKVNNLGVASFSSISLLIRSSPNLKRVTFDDIGCWKNDTFKVFIDSISESNVSDLSIGLSVCNDNLVDYGYLSKAISTPNSLRKLSLKSRMKIEGIGKIFESLSGCKLEELDLSTTPLNSDNFSALMNGIISSNIRFLNLSSSAIDSSGLLTLSEAIINGSLLEMIDISGNQNISTTAFQRFSEAVESERSNVKKVINRQ